MQLGTWAPLKSWETRGDDKAWICAVCGQPWDEELEEEDDFVVSPAISWFIGAAIGFLMRLIANHGTVLQPLQVGPARRHSTMCYVPPHWGRIVAD